MVQEEVQIRCRRCGHANEFKMGRVYTVFRCERCQQEIDLDASLTMDLIPADKPVRLRRDTVTVGLRPREPDDWSACERCGGRADLEDEDVLGVDRRYRCTSCGNVFSQSGQPENEQTAQH
jgi:DNA-directed RNA polymerase subunit RPC12/RpoP